MTKKSSTPAIRFKGFTDTWEQRKLSHFLEVSSEKNTDNLYTKDDVLSVSGDFGVVNQIEFQGRSFAGASVSNYGVVHTGDVVYTKSPLKANPYGIIKANKGKTGIVSVLYGVYHTRENANADFIQMYFEQDARLNNYLRPLVNKGAKNTLLISDTDALGGEVCLAPTFDEQKAIGQFFNSLDNLITLHQRKYDKLTNVKKSMLEKMFPKNGSNVPEIRFKGFTEAWEQRKLGDVVKEITRNDPESEAPIMMITANNGFIEQSERYAFNNAGESLKKYILLKKGELAYNHGASKLRPYGSCFALTTAENARIPFVYHCFSAENQNAEFMSIELNGAEIENQLRKIVSSGARMDGLLNISFDEYTSVSVLLPSTEEQDCIADFFRQLDNLITLHQRELEKLKNLKKACLEKMFV